MSNSTRSSSPAYLLSRATLQANLVRTILFPTGNESTRLYPHLLTSAYGIKILKQFRLTCFDDYLLCLSRIQSLSSCLQQKHGSLQILLRQFCQFPAVINSVRFFFYLNPMLGIYSTDPLLFASVLSSNIGCGSWQAYRFLQILLWTILVPAGYVSTSFLRHLDPRLKVQACPITPDKPELCAGNLLQCSRLLHFPSLGRYSYCCNRLARSLPLD
jgi:hypothetical protein